MKKLKGSLISILSALLVIVTVTSCSKDGGDGDGPQIDNISPSSAVTGAAVVITGQNLSGSTVMMGGISAAISANTETSISTSIPSGLSAGSHKVVVTNPDGSDEATITVTGAGAPPVINSITPAEVAIGQSITITGTALAGATVQIATKVSSVTSNTGTAIVVVVPSGIALGSASVRVTTSLGTVVSSVIIK